MTAVNLRSYKHVQPTTNRVSNRNETAQFELMDNVTLRAELERLHRESFGWALNCCARDPAEAEEVLQQVYLKVLEGRAQYHGRASFRTWLFAVIRKTAADERRRYMLRRLRLLEYEERAERNGSDHGPDETVCDSERRTLFQQALAVLPERQREVLLLVFYHDLHLSDAAEVMGVSLGSARTHYERGKKRLREWMKRSKLWHEIEWGRTAVAAALP